MKTHANLFCCFFWFIIILSAPELKVQVHYGDNGSNRVICLCNQKGITFKNNMPMQNSYHYIYTPSVFCYDKHKKNFDIQFSLKRHETV